MLLKYVWGILENPKITWQAIRDDDRSSASQMLWVLVPLALISPVSGLIGTTQIGWQIGVGEPVKLTVNSALQISVVYFGAILITVCVIASLIHWMSETYGHQISFPNSLSITIYSAVPLFLIGLTQMYPVLWVNFLFGLPALAYAVYLLFLGVPIVANIPVERGFMFSSAILAVALVALVGLLASTVVMWSVGIAPAFST